MTKRQVRQSQRKSMSKAYRHRETHVCTHGIHKNTGLEAIIKVQKYVCIFKTKNKNPNLTLKRHRTSLRCTCIHSVLAFYCWAWVQPIRMFIPSMRLLWRNLKFHLLLLFLGDGSGLVLGYVTASLCSSVTPNGTDLVSPCVCMLPLSP